jgi:hypothetical protein
VDLNFLFMFSFNSNFILFLDNFFYFFSWKNSLDFSFFYTNFTFYTSTYMQNFSINSSIIDLINQFFSFFNFTINYFFNFVNLNLNKNSSSLYIENTNSSFLFLNVIFYLFFYNLILVSSKLRNLKIAFSANI